MTEITQQELEVKEWPLKEIGDEHFFGYVAALGFYPKEWGECGGLIPYVDFAYSNRYERFRLPNDEGLIAGLAQYLLGNLHFTFEDDGPYGKVWIKKMKEGYAIDLP